jgi:hypothetical protein
MSQDQWNGGKCNTCNRPVVSSDGDWNPMGAECAYSNGVSCRAYAEKKRSVSVVNPNHDQHPLAQAFTKSLKEWLDAGASLSSVLQTLEEECYSRADRIAAGENLLGHESEWEAAGHEFFKFDEPEGLT